MKQGMTVAPEAKPLSPDQLGDNVVGFQEVKPKEEIDLRKTEEEKVREQTEQLENEQSGPQRMMICPNCGLDIRQLQDRIPTEDEKARWIRHVFGEERFTRSYSLFGETVTVVFRNASTKENDEIVAQLQDDVVNGEIPVPSLISNTASIYRSQCYFLAVCLLSLAKEGVTKQYPSVTADTYKPDNDKDTRRPVRRAYEKIIQPLPEAIIQTLIYYLKDFEALMSTFIRHSDDPDFW